MSPPTPTDGDGADRGLHPASAAPIITENATTTKQHVRPDRSGSDEAPADGWATRIFRSGKARFDTDCAFCRLCGRYHVHRALEAAAVYRRARPCRPSTRYSIVVVATLPDAVDAGPAELRVREFPEVSA